MSSKITITPSEITAVLDSIPPAAAPAGGDALAAAMAAMDAREKTAQQVRVVIYRFDADAGTAAADTVQAQLTGGQLPLHSVAQDLNCDLQLIELGRGPWVVDDTARAAAFGMMAAEQDTGLLVVAGFGAGSDARAAQTDHSRFFETASPETAALLGAMIAGARARIPVIAEGPQGKAAALALRTLRADLCAGIFLCGVDGDVPGIPVFANTDESDPMVADAAITLAAVFMQEHLRKAA